MTMEPMRPAPALPSVFDEPPALLAAPSHPAAALLADLAASHEAHMRGFAELHGRFLALQAAASQALFGGPPAPAPSPPVVVQSYDPTGRVPAHVIVDERPPGASPARVELRLWGPPPSRVEPLRYAVEEASASHRRLALSAGDRPFGALVEHATVPNMTHAITPPLTASERAFPPERVDAYRRGDVYGCFGEALRRAATHVRTPQLVDAESSALRSITHLDATHLRAAVEGIRPSFGGLLQSGLEALAFWIVARGATLAYDGFRFALTDEPVFVDRVAELESPTMVSLTLESARDVAPVRAIATATWSVDDRVVATGRLVLALVPDWPLDDWRHAPKGAPGVFGTPRALAGLEGHVPVAPPLRFNDLPLGYPELLASSLGPPSASIGARHARLDGPGRTLRLPAPPYLFLDRLRAMSVEEGACLGGTAVGELDVASEPAWYLDSARDPRLPLAVMLESPLQLAGLLSCFTCGWEVLYDRDLRYRNLDGEITWSREVSAGERLTSHCAINSVVTMGDTILFGIEIDARVGDALAYRVTTRSGAFPPADLLAQEVGSSRVDLQACKLEYSIVSPK